MTSLKRKVITGTFWSIGLQIISMIIVLATNILLARVLTPTEFGQVGIIMFFVVLTNIFTKGGLAAAIVRKPNPTKEDYSTVFVFNLVVSIALYFLLVLFSGVIARYYNDDSLQELLIATSLILIISSFQIVQNTKLVVEMRFKQKSIYTFVSSVIGSLLGIVSAYYGAGVWALVIMPIATTSTLSILYWVFEGGYFSLYFDKNSFKSLFSFGMNTTLTTILNTVFDNIYQLVLGKVFSISQVGLFYQAKRLQDVPGSVINVLSQGVIFSALSKVQNNKTLFVVTYNKLILAFTVIMGIMTTVTYLYSENIILMLYGREWLGAVFYMKLLSIASFFYLQEMVNKIIFKVFNETRQLLNLELFKKVIQSVSIILGIFFSSIEILIVGFVITSIISYTINYYFSRKVLGEVSSYEISLLIKISIVGLGLVTCFNICYFYFKIEGYLTFVFLPILIFLYFFILKVLNVFNVLKEMRRLHMEMLKR